MHELSIALSVVETVAARLAAGERVTVVSLRVGALAGVDPQALRFAFPVACESTALAGSRLEIEDVPLVAYCPNCQAERELAGPQRLRCPVCRTPTPRLVAGRELEILSFETG